MKDLQLYQWDDLDKRVPITFRVPVKKKYELLKCSKDIGASLTDVLEVLTEDPELKLKYDLRQIVFENTKAKARLKTMEIEKAEDEMKIHELDERLKNLEKIKLDASIRAWEYRKFITNNMDLLEINKTTIENIKRLNDNLREQRK